MMSEKVKSVNGPTETNVHAPLPPYGHQNTSFSPEDNGTAAWGHTCLLVTGLDPIQNKS